jgi:Flp pilus assembly protein TadD
MRKLARYLVFAGLSCAGPHLSAVSVTYLVFPPENRSKIPDSAWIGDALAFSIGTQLQSPGIEVVEFELRYQLLESSGLPLNATLSRASMILVAQLAGADRLVFGSYDGTLQEMQVTLQVLDLKSMKLTGNIQASGPVKVLPALENELAWEALTRTGMTPIHSREEFRNKARVIPDGAYMHYIRSLAQTDKGEQIKLLLKAVLSYSDFPEALFRLGHLYYENGDCQNAMPRLKPTPAAQPFFPEGQFMLGNCYLRQNAPAEAIQAYSAILPFAQPLEVLNNLGVAYLRQGDYAQAAQSLERAKALAKTDPIVVLNLAILWHLQGDSERASSLLEESLRSGPNQGLLHHLQGLILASQGRTDQSAAALAEANRLGIETGRLKTDDLRGLTQVFPVWRDPD